MNLPTINERKQESISQQTHLNLHLLKTILQFEKDNNYKFEPYEVDAVLLELIQRNHKSYLNAKFGNENI